MVLLVLDLLRRALLPLCMVAIVCARPSEALWLVSQDNVTRTSEPVAIHTAEGAASWVPTFTTSAISDSNSTSGLLIVEPCSYFVASVEVRLWFNNGTMQMHTLHRRNSVSGHVLLSLRLPYVSLNRIEMQCADDGVFRYAFVTESRRSSTWSDALMSRHDIPWVVPSPTEPWLVEAEAAVSHSAADEIVVHVTAHNVTTVALADRLVCVFLFPESETGAWGWFGSTCSTSHPSNATADMHVGGSGSVGGVVWRCGRGTSVDMPLRLQQGILWGTQYRAEVTVVDEWSGKAGFIGAASVSWPNASTGPAASADRTNSKVGTSAWLGTITATLINCAVSMIGRVGILIHRDFVKRLSGVFLALALGTLSGVVFFRLLPEISEEFEGISTSVSVTMLGSVGFGVVLEICLELLSHSADNTNTDGEDCHTAAHQQQQQQQSTNNDRSKPPQHGDGADAYAVGAVDADDDGEGWDVEGTTMTAIGAVSRPATLTLPTQAPSGISSHSIVGAAATTAPRYNAIVASLVADAFHNFVDGILIGIAFQKSVGTGAMVTVGIILDEIPQELGDFVILVDAGWPLCRAAVAKTMVQGSSMVGGVMILLTMDLGLTWHRWLLPAATGQLLYLTLGHLLPKVLRQQQRSPTELAAIAVAIAVGLAVMGSLTLFPE